MGVAAPRAPVSWVSGLGQRPLKISVTGSSLLGNCDLENNFHKKLWTFPKKV